MGWNTDSIANYMIPGKLPYHSQPHLCNGDNNSTYLTDEESTS